MKLTSLELRGFKSFPDKTVLDFNNGLTAVVGPNGSGKSNISDAIRWVLGEMSAKSVRGSKMEDVIFGGADSRRPMAYAEVSLTIDNTVGEGRLSTEYDEVTVTRRCYRSGESEYLINQKAVRLKDIAELFMNTGVGKTGYSMIGQGKIAEIISQKSDERRQIFEEAAGISKYRYKKNEAERKMTSVEDNLVRLTDIQTELGSRVGPLERESNKAKRYLELYDEKKALDIALWLFDIERIRTELQECEDKYAIAKHSLEIADDTLAALETQNERTFAAAQENKLNSERTAEQIKSASEHSIQLEGLVSIRENDIAHYNELISQANIDIAERLEARRVHEESLNTLQKECHEMRARLAQLDTQREALTAQLEAQYQKRTELEGAQNANRTAHTDLRDRMTESRIRLSALEAAGESTANRREEIEEQIRSLSDSAASLTRRIEQAQKTIGDYASKSQELRDRIAQIDRAAGDAQAESERLTDECNRISLDISARSQRIDTLQRMEELFEGYAQSVKSVMRASERGQLPGICGPLSHVISVKAKYAVAMETVLGNNLQNIVVEDEDAAKRAIAYLKENNAGRSTFYPLTSMKPSPSPVSEQTLATYAGYLGIASDLVTFEEKYRNVVTYLLGRTAVFDTLDNATAMSRKTGYKLRAVTLDGQIINAGGSFTGGSVKRDSGMLTRAAEMEKIRQEISRLEKEKAEKQTQAAAFTAQVNETAGEKESLAAQLELLQSLSHAEDTQMKVLDAQRENDTQRANEQRAILDNLQGLTERNEQECAALAAFLQTSDTQLQALQTEWDTIERERTALSGSITKLQQSEAQLKLDYTEQRKDLESCERTYALTEQTIAEVDANVERARAAVLQNQQAIAQAKSDMGSAKEQMEQAGEEIKRLRGIQDELRSLSLKQDETIAALREKIRQNSHDRENVFREYTRLDARLTQIRAEQDKLTSRLWEEYELTASTAAEAGYLPTQEGERTQSMARQTELRNKIRALGSVNTNAIEEYREVKERYDFMTAQITDLTNSRQDLRDIIIDLEKEMRQRFVTVMDQLNRAFKQVFRELFGGGNAELIIDDMENVLESGITINVAPPGKIIKNLSLLSGGEQSFVAVALLFAILQVNPTPFCVLDEVEAALDDVNVARFAEYARRFSDKTQFIIITHRRGTMERADTIYGVTMPERGISRVLTLNVGEVEAKLGVKL